MASGRGARSKGLLLDVVLVMVIAAGQVLGDGGALRRGRRTQASLVF